MSKTWKDLPRNVEDKRVLKKLKKPSKPKPKDTETKVLDVSDLCWPDGDHTY